MFLTSAIQMLPKTVADDLKYNKSTSERFESATILFSEIEGFNDLARSFTYEMPFIIC